jgi:hypothetical protein
MSFVFLSHANPDKPKVRHIVEALIAAGLKVWLDNPAAMGFSAKDIKDHFHHLEAGGQWRDKIDAGLRTAGVVLVCWSEKAKEDRKVWHAEASVARALQKLVACRIDDIDPQSLPDDHGAEQIPDLRADEPASDGGNGWFGPKRVPRAEDKLATELALLVEAVKAKMAAASAQRFERRVERRIQRDAFAPYLIDRADQESALGSAIDVVRKSGGVRAFLIAGPENECPDEFMVRLEKYTSPKRLNDRAWYQVRVEWPGNHAPAQFGQEYRARLAPQLSLPSDASAEEIANALSQRDRPVAVVSLLRAEEWQTKEPERIKTWLQWWEALGNGPIRCSVIPIMCVKMPKAKPGWKFCPSGCGPGGTVSNTQIWREAQRLQKNGAGSSWFSLFGRRKSMAPIGAPPVLHPVRMGDVDRWMSDHLGDLISDDRDKAKSIVEQLFGQRSAARHGVPLEDFAKAMRPVFSDTR